MAGAPSADADSGQALGSRPETLEEVQAQLRDMGLDGWLLYDFHGRNPVAVSLLGLEGPTRRSFALIPSEGEPEAVVHAIEASSWRHWPWGRKTYQGWRELEKALGELIPREARLAMEVSPGSAVPTLDLVPAGAIDLVRASGARVESSADLVSAFYSRWSTEQLQRHRETAAAVRRVAMEAFQRAAEGVLAEDEVRERELADWIRSRLPDEGLPVGVDCIVAVGRTAADPHYQPGDDGGELLVRGEPVLIDLWGQPSTQDAPADQTWMGYLGPTEEIPPRYREVWDAVRGARDRALELLEERREVQGWEVDEACRAFLDELGFGRHFLHRTGHSIDRELHGSGPNLDNLETRDERRLLPGVGFSVEPGVYIPGEIGVRSVVNVHLGLAGPEVPTPEPPREILALLDG